MIAGERLQEILNIFLLKYCLWINRRFFVWPRTIAVSRLAQQGTSVTNWFSACSLAGLAEKRVSALNNY